ncbi:DAD1 [Cordylochernes scorpioides]|uniref:Dolichyl-diphosphooligosaccharide--protein glycosyltransferase subunit DAD1 n=1 Tax=Cordylochernes scorpioides TaxID=51811 RepID=A0ABY6K7L2_9ARAC|nr:DAD1 [Cordylochernes scorpioides]
MINGKIKVSRDGIASGHGICPLSHINKPRKAIMAVSVVEVVSKFIHDYKASTPQKLKIIDAYLIYILLTGIIQFVYCCIVGTFPFNSFLSGFISSVVSFVLAVHVVQAMIIMVGRSWRLHLLEHVFGAVCLRLQVNPQNKAHFGHMSAERAFGDFIFAHVILHLVVINFIG